MNIPDFRNLLKKLLLIIPLGVTVHLFVIFLKTDARGWAWLFAFSKKKMVWAFVLTFIPWFMNSARVWSWTRFLRNPLKYTDCLAIVIGSDLGSAVTPSAVGGGYVKMGMLIWKGFSAGEAASLMFLGTIEDMLFFLFALPVAVWVGGLHRLSLPIAFQDMVRSISHRFFIAGLVGIFLALSFLLFFRMGWYPFQASERATRFFKSVRHAFADFSGVWKKIGRRGRLLLLGNVGLAAVQWTSRYMVVSAFWAALGIPVYPVRFFVFQWLVFTAGVFFPLPGGTLGVEAAFYWIYRAYIPKEILAVAVTGWRFMTYYVLLLIGLLVFPILIC